MTTRVSDHQHDIVVKAQDPIYLNPFGGLKWKVLLQFLMECVIFSTLIAYGVWIKPRFQIIDMTLEFISQNNKCIHSCMSF